MKTRAKLTAIENDRAVTEASEPEFCRAFRLAVLLALKEEGALSESQCLWAQERLREGGSRP